MVCVPLQIYIGKNANLDNEIGLCSRIVVLELIDGLEHNGISLYMDNYYTSPWLFLTLYDNGVNACGSARKARKYYPPELDVSNSSVESGYYDYRSSEPLLACVWKDKHIIYFLSTIHVADCTKESTVMRRRTNDGERVSVTCPPYLIDYQALMRGVDHSDQMIGYYNIGRRSVKWWKRGSSHILEVCIFNAYTLDQHGKAGTEKRDYLAFRTALAEELIGQNNHVVVGCSRVGTPHPRERMRNAESMKHCVSTHTMPLYSGPDKRNPTKHHTQAAVERR